MQLFETRQAIREAVAAARREGKTIGVVPTMGALHAGHLSLVEACTKACDFTVVTIFVNPTQFGPGEDFDKYPRRLEADLEALAPYGVDAVFAPTNEEMYGPRHSTYVVVEGVTEPWEGACRPGHFRGVTTIVTKLFQIVQPDVAFFGQKDYQQALVVRRMVADLDMPIEIRVCPIVREPDGLALSSRNVYLSADERRQARSLSQSLELAARLVAEGLRDPATIRECMLEQLSQHPDVRVEYVALVDPETMQEVASIDAPVVAAVAAFVGETRLIDNRLLTPAEPSSDGA